MQDKDGRRHHLQMDRDCSEFYNFQINRDSSVPVIQDSSNKNEFPVLYGEELEKAGKKMKMWSDKLQKGLERLNETQSPTQNHQDRCRLVETFSSAVSLWLRQIMAAIHLI